MPRKVERRLWIGRFHPDSSVIPRRPEDPEAGGSGVTSNLEPLDAYLDEWTIASHTYELLQDGDCLITVLLERPYGEELA